VTLAIRRPSQRPLALRAGAALAACAAASALLTGCGAGPSQIGAAALVGDHAISLDVVQQNIANVLIDNADARQLQQQKPSAFPPVARTIVQLSVWHELTTQLAAKLGVRVSQDQVDRVYNPAAASGKGLALSQTSNILVKGDALRNYIYDELVWTAVGTKQAGTALATFDFALVADRNAAQALVDKVVAHPENDRQLFSAVSANDTGVKPLIDATASPATVPDGTQLLFSANAGEVIGFPMQSQNAWVVAYVKKRVDNAGDTSGGQDVSQLAEGFGQAQMSRFGQDAGVTLNPRFGVWEPLIGVVSPSDGESQTIMAKVRTPQP
jgi:parvulin-like peptidyl-prolyl isomerase